MVFFAALFSTTFNTVHMQQTFLIRNGHNLYNYYRVKHITIYLSVSHEVNGRV